MNGLTTPLYTGLGPRLDTQQVQRLNTIPYRGRPRGWTVDRLSVDRAQMMFPQALHRDHCSGSESEAGHRIRGA